jgi:hypothetical protein
MRSKKATDDVCKLLGDDDLRKMTQFINNIYATGEQPKKATEVVNALKKPQAT